MAWIESNQELGRHPKTKKLARLLDISVVTAVGHLHYLWWWALDFAQEGLLNKYDEFDIAEACMWDSDQKVFVDALIESGFIDNKDSVLCIHDWYEYAGILIERRRSDAERKRLDREKKKKATNKTSKKKTSIGRPADITEESTDVLRNRTLPYPTVPNQINNNNNNAREKEIVLKTAEVEQVDLAINLNTLPDEPVAIGTESINWAEKNWGRMIPKGEADKILAYCDEFLSKGSPEPDAVVIEGLRRCLSAGVRNMFYLDSVLRSWREADVLTMSQIEALDTEHKNKSQKEHKRNKDPVDKPPKQTKYDNFYL